MRKVVIVQEYVPQYRVPFFEILQEQAKKQGIDVNVAYGAVSAAQATRRDAKGLEGGISIDQKEWRIAGRRLVIRKISDAIADADMVILEQARRNLDAYRLLTRKVHGGPVIALWGHGTDYTRQNSSMERRLSRWLTSKADWFFAYTCGGKKSVVENGFPLHQSTVVQNSIDTTSLQASVRSIDSRSVLDFTERNGLQGKTALFIGALDPSKRLTFLEEAGRIAHHLDPDFRLLIAGEGDMRRQVEEWASQHTWMSYLGALFGPEKALAMASSQILAMPGRVGLVAVDSFASALPIITTDWPWHAPEFEYLENGRNAVISPDIASSYAASMIEVLNDSRLLSQLQEAASHDAGKYTVQAMAENFLSGIRGALMLRNS